jgi:hypothetical protein
VPKVGDTGRYTYRQLRREVRVTRVSASRRTLWFCFVDDGLPVGGESGWRRVRLGVHGRLAHRERFWRQWHIMDGGRIGHIELPVRGTL